ncbi:N-acetyl-gamma-glutamyl-phosphate reductase, common form [Thioflavicoccus mobilis 8321]|uniref:N-acetyl-gamma-glutamyl-phosphate reductase n=1 Tax=Thioflavicoccus mobilis 8321 TaxID=765912 RepID=L0GSI5_9GAMM|nr:N-acetyl-gamma-glutamyl-phosphate reductase [Thioflavicoccus mobilis]AGA88951.1 N-acetyl-gamma-glutamyl-phosphate reductase, common form [Thioflavicoccus mobilis 8321]
MTRVGIVGGTGYTGSELLRLLVGHPQVEIAAITSRGEAGTDVCDLFAHLRGHLSLRFSEPSPEALGDCDLVFFATPNGTAMRMVPELLGRGARIIDLAADFRLKDAALWERWYGMPHACPELLEEAVYGLPELNREAIREARLIANPGCYPTAVTLGLAPLVEAGAVDPTWLIADAKSGVSGAGRKAATGLLMAEVGEGFKAYSSAGHRHAPEIMQNLAALTDQPVQLTFVPHLVPMIRGIEATLYGRRAAAGLDLQRLFAERYADEPFVDVMPSGSHPDTRSVRGANLCRIAVGEQPGGVVIVQSVIDNLVKGAAGQAIQNMNLMLGLEETLGLRGVPLQP